MQDDMFVVHVRPSNDPTTSYDSVLESLFKTEFLHVLSKITKKSVQIDFSDRVTFNVKKQGFMQVIFFRASFFYIVSALMCFIAR